MKAWVYAVRLAAGWQARFTVAWEIDEAYWLDMDYRKGAAEAWGDGGMARSIGERKIMVEEPSVFPTERAEVMIRLERMLPLGEAEEGCGRLQAKLQKAFSGRNSEHRERGEESVQSEILSVGEWLRNLAGAGEREDAASVRQRYALERLRSTGRSEPLPLASARDCRGKNDMTQVFEVLYAASARARSAAEVERRRAAGGDHALRVKQVVPLIEGRALLREEAAALLTELMPSGYGVEGTATGVGSSLANARGDVIGAGPAAPAAGPAACGSVGTNTVPTLRAPTAGAASPSDGSMLALLQLGALLGAVRLTAAVAPQPANRRRPHQRCRRCGSGEAALRRTPCASCGSSGCAVCEACLALGRSRACGLLVRGAAPSASPLRAPQAERLPQAADICARWGLSPAQRAASEQAVEFLLSGGERASAPHTPAPAARARVAVTRAPAHTETPAPAAWLRQLAASFTRGDGMRDAPSDDPMAIQPRSFLLWAVTGAGKTEMVFPLLDAVLRTGGRALLATPRRDVVLELAPRLAKAFPERTLAVLYGGSGNRWQRAELTLATTHQLMRFHQSFDLVLIDELDAFPYHGDPMLHYAAAAARKPDGVTVLLSATPPAALQRAARCGRLPHAKVPVRYHRHPLPVPALLRLPPMRRWAAAKLGIAGSGRRKAPSKQTARLYARLGESLARGAQVFVFVPYIRQIDGLVSVFRQQAAAWGIPAAAIDGTSSQDDGRRDKVVAFRERRLRLLVTTTILERGVTVPRSDVFILDAHAKLFDEAALVQMAGRAGRSADDPAGRVHFCGEYRTQAQAGAIRQIAAMNRLARRGGYLLEGDGSR